MESDHALHRHTPKLAVVDPRGLAVATVDYYRKSSAEVRCEPRVTRETFDGVGRSVANWDARLGAGSTPIASRTSIPGLSGVSLLTVSVDAGWRLALQDEAGQVRQTWDGAGNTSCFEYDLLGRPLSVEQASASTPAQCLERLYYGAAEPEVSLRSQCGRLIRHADTAGIWEVEDYSLQGAPLTESRRFLAELDHLGWPVDLSQQNALLEQGEDKTYRTRWHYHASGMTFKQVDAAGHTRRYAYSVQGQLQGTWLKVAGKPEQWLVSDITYNASGQVEHERAGNGVISSSVYDPCDGRLRQLLAVKGERHLQDLRYDYDPVGNILCMKDESQPVSWFANQRVDPVNRYGYDSLYQLISATGREVASAGNGPGLPELVSPPDPSQLQNYSQSWSYDAGGNLLEQRHSNNPTHFMDIDTVSNRGLKRVEGQVPDFDANFDRNGNLLFLTPGQPLRWTVRNQLDEAVLVSRVQGQNDSERYVYDATGMRVRKVRVAQAANVVRTAEVRYLPGLEIRTEGAGNPDEVLHEVSVQAGRSSVRLLHWMLGRPDDIEEDQLRYSLVDHLGSATLELDSDGLLISYEGYYSYGETAWRMGRSQVEAKYKVVRYSGKERDATGLYHYGFRYYAPFLLRWINPDPAGFVDGLNRFCIVGNNPICYKDIMGLYTGADDEYHLVDAKVEGRGRKGFSKEQLAKIDKALLYASEITAESLDVLIGKDSSYFENILQKVFHGSMSSGDFAKSVKVMHDAVQLYMENGRLGDQLALIRPLDARSPVIASTIGDDVHKRIFLTRTIIGGSTVSDTITLALAFLHEITHLELGARDLHYYGAPTKNMNVEEYWKHVDHAVDELSSPSKWDKNLSENIKRLGAADLKAAFGTSNSRKIISTFYPYKPLALKINADSLSTAVALYGLPRLEKRLSEGARRRPSHRYEPAPDYD